MTAEKQNQKNIERIAESTLGIFLEISLAADSQIGQIHSSQFCSANR